jgi:hypothetical protein
MSFSLKCARLKFSIAKRFQRTIRRLQGKSKDKKLEESLRARILSRYFAQKYSPVLKNLTQKPTADNPETIWQFWDNPNGRTTPEIVKASFESIKRNKGDFDHKILDNSSIGNYSDLPGYVFDRLKSGKMIYAHFADLLRLNLLKNHGGIWMDATLYMTGSVSQSIINEDFFVFLTDKLTDFPYSFMQNFFVRAKKDSYLCEAWYQMCIEYWKKEIKSVDYFQHQLMFKALVYSNPTAKMLFAQMPHISEDEVIQFNNRLFEKFDANEWERIMNLSFFQKTTYRKAGDTWANATDYPDTFFSKLCERI